ncbi:MAG: Cys-tRNA(Pro) deacylase [Bradymonadia bacterium]
MPKNNPNKTNVMRILDQAHVSYQIGDYQASGAISADEAAHAMGQPETHVFKTLVTVGSSGEHYVFVVPACASLDLKKAAAAVGEKSVEMIKSKLLLPLTGYIHGGCSPIGMKKFFTTTFDRSAQALHAIWFSAGKIGFMVQVAVEDLQTLIPIAFDDITP